MEFCGYYGIYLPSLLFIRVLSWISMVWNIEIPWFQSTRVKDLSIFLSLLDYQLHTIVHLPSRFRAFYKKKHLTKAQGKVL
jgi:hypothetical protein